ncbi:hypothetical protein FQR65_LT02069 [Abscondita terminalis]|nr:hypothetical protein FQR65_LT02069 [Abscondita terminalis]
MADFYENIINNIIRKHIKGPINIFSVDKEYVLPPGENYVSELLRVVIKFSENNSDKVQSMSLITKSPLDSDLERDEKINFFGCEIAVYSEILPLLKTLEHTEKIAPNSYYASKTPKKLIILEDLSLLHYKMCNRLEGLDLEHCLLSVEKLAYFHAASLLLYEQNPKIMDKYLRKGLYKEESFKKWDSIAFKEVLSACQRNSSLQKFTNLISQELLEKCSTIRDVDPKLNVLNHGDFWCNNLMFQYDENDRLNDVMFNTQIFKVKTKIPTCEEFDKEFCDKAYIGFGITVTFMHLVKAGKREDASITNFLENEGEGSFRHHCFNNSNYLSHLESSLSFYDSLGLFDH